MKRIAIIFLLAVAGASGVAFAQSPRVVTSDKAGWHKIGETTVDFKREKDEIAVLGANRFAAIKFRVLDEPVDLMSVNVIYDSGEDQSVTIIDHLKVSGDSREINLNGGERNVRKIVFVYKTLPNQKDKKAHVEIWGLKTNTDTH
jgi:hypothetical protein